MPYSYVKTLVGCDIIQAAEYLPCAVLCNHI